MSARLRQRDRRGLVDLARDKRALRFLMWCARPLLATAARLGADRPKCEALLIARLRIDLRAGGIRQAKDPSVGAGLFVTCLVQLFFGLTVAVGAVLIPEPGLAVAAVQAFLLLMIGTMLASDYLASLVEPAETDVVAPRPVDGRTVLLARLVHLALYLSLPAACLTVPAWIAGAFRAEGLVWVLVLPVASVLTVCFVVCALFIGFQVVLTRASGDRLANLLLRAQLVASFVMWGGFYACSGLLAKEGVRDWLTSSSWTHVLVPPLWSAGLVREAAGVAEGVDHVLALLAIALPLAALLVVVLLAGPRLVVALASQRQAGGDVPSEPGPFARWVGRLVQPGVERAGLDAFLAIARREQGFRRRVYPLLVAPFVMFLYLTFTSHRTGGEQIGVWGTMLPFMYGVIILLQVRFSDTPEASWLLRACPVERPGLYVSGVVKGVLFAFLLPWLLLVLAAGGLLQQEMDVVQMLSGTALALLVLLGMARRIVTQELPFSRTFTTKRAQQTALMFGAMVLGGLLLAAQKLLAEVAYGSAAALLVAVPVIAWQARSLRNLRVWIAPFERR